ncbi:MAG: TIGR02391 family protein [Planctomycetes bacterium]|nr:TIGR02391 family protein [Planctomycetota bacterium]
MYALNDVERRLLVDLWKRVDEKWLGPSYDEFCADHADDVESIESLQTKRLIQLEAVGGRNAVRLNLEGFFYLPEEFQSAALEGVDALIQGLQTLFRKRKGGQFTVPQIAQETGMDPGTVQRRGAVLQRFGASMGAVLDSKIDFNGNYIQPNPAFLKIRSIKQLYDQRREEHVGAVKQLERMGQAPMAPLPAAAMSFAPGGSDSDVAAIYAKLVHHPRIRSVSEGLFRDRHYAQAIFEAYKALANLVKEKSGAGSDGRDLMAKVFSKDRPILKLTAMSTTSEKDEQEGFMLIYMGAMVGIRNPKAHDNVVQNDPIRTVQYLGFADLLAHRVEEASMAAKVSYEGGASKENNRSVQRAKDA